MARTKKTGPADPPRETSQAPSRTQRRILVIVGAALATWILALVAMAAFT